MTMGRRAGAAALRRALGAARRAGDVATESELRHAAAAVEQMLFLQGKVAAEVIGGRGRLNELADAAFGVTSQWGEDGIIEWLVRRLDPEVTSFVEFGVEDFSEANCRFLMQNRNWRGLVFDGSAQNIARLTADSVYWRHDLIAEERFITAESIDELIRQAGFSGEIGLLSVDIDGVDYWVLEAISCVSPQILVVEYNGVFGDLRPLTVPYRADFDRFEAHHSGLYFGASLMAVRRAAEAKGYVFLGTPRTGVNAFFVRSDLAPRVLEGLGAITAYPTRYRESRDETGALTYLRGIERFEAIADQTVVDLETGEAVPLGEATRCYSPAWLKRLG